MIKGGKVVPGWGVAPKQGREQWLKSFEEVKHLGELHGKDLTKDGLITPNQARKLGLDAATVAQYAGRKGTGLALVQDTEAKTRQAFHGA